MGNNSFIKKAKLKTTRMDSTRSVEDILNDIHPKASGALYEKRWNEFLCYCGQNEPDDDMLLKFFDHLRRERGYKASTLWSWFSSINAKYAIIYGKKLQTMPKVVALMKSYNVGYERKAAKVFTREQIYDFLEMGLTTPRAILVKAVACLGFSGGLRMHELRSLDIADLKEDKDGFLVTYNPAKQRGERKENTFLVPRNVSEPNRCMFSHVQFYLFRLKASGITSGPLFRTCLTRKYSTLPMGKNILGQCGVYMAESLQLDEPKRYTGHCLRRSAACAAADAGATTMDMQRHMNWKR